MNKKTTPPNQIDELTVLVRELFAAYPATNITPATIAVYMSSLSELPVDDLRTAIKQLIRKAEFPPTVASIFSAVEKLKQERTKSYFAEIERQEIERSLSREGAIPMSEDIKQQIKEIFAKVKMR